jgi:non-ribosomal peptide synthetase component E (peptide arylation enzyme)
MAPDLLSIIHGPSAPVPVSETFGRLLARHVRERGSHPAIISHHQNVVLTYKALDERSDALAASFYDYGVRNGDMVAIMLGSRTEYIEVGYILFPSGIKSTNY